MRGIVLKALVCLIGLFVFLTLAIGGTMFYFDDVKAKAQGKKCSDFRQALDLCPDK